MKIFKRDPKTGRRLASNHPAYKTASWYCKFIVDGQTYSKSLGTVPSTEANKRAVAWKRAVENARWDLIKNPVRDCPSIAEYLAWYETATLDVQHTSRLNNMRCLRRILRAADLKESAKLEALDESVFNSYRNASLAAVQDSDQLAVASRKRGTNSVTHQAVSIFADETIQAAQDAGMHVPAEHLRALKASLKTRKFKRGTKTEYNPPSDAKIAAALAAWEASEDPTIFLTMGLELAFGLRANEVAQAKWEWLTVREGVPCISGKLKVKAGTGLLVVRALDPFWTTFQTKAKASGWWKDSGPIVEGPTGFNDPSAKVGRLLRSCGWETRLTNHALRAYSGSLVAMRYGIYAAQTWLRHSSVTTTEGHYSHFVKTFQADAPEKVPCKYATA